jgi:hypothetical protein
MKEVFADVDFFSEKRLTGLCDINLGNCRHLKKIYTEGRMMSIKKGAG